MGNIQSVVIKVTRGKVYFMTVHALPTQRGCGIT